MRTSPRRISDLAAPRSRGAFTFVELLVVCSIMAVLSGVMILSLDSASSRSRLRKEARTLAAKIREVRANALSGEGSRFLTFSMRDGRYSVAVPDKGVVPGEFRPGEEEEVRVLPEGVKIIRIEAREDFARGFFYLGDPVSVLFDKKGVVSEHRIVLQNESKEEIALRVHPLVNSVEIEAP